MQEIEKESHPPEQNNDKEDHRQPEKSSLKREKISSMLYIHPWMPANYMHFAETNIKTLL